MNRRAIGICLGASTVKGVALEEEHGRIAVVDTTTLTHGGDPRRGFEQLLDEYQVDEACLGAITGRRFTHNVTAPTITETEAIEHALRVGDVNSAEFDAVLSLGAESFIAYFLAPDGTISTVETGNKCASGTGEFFLQQLRRMDVDVDEAIRLARDADPYTVSGRCSVFCKSDCTHALNKGIPIGRVTAGLCRMMVEKVCELLESSSGRRVLAIGGVTRNAAVMDRLAERVDRLVIPPSADCFEALGAGFYAMSKDIRLGQGRDGLLRRTASASSFSFLPPLHQAESQVTFMTPKRGSAADGDSCLVGLDVGSTTTKAVVLRRLDNAVLGSVYLRTNGDPVGAARRCYRALLEQVEKRVEIIGLGVTGSGRHIAGLHASTPAIINEIIAHATCAAHFDPEVDTIFEIGGQDAKYTHLTNGVPSDYAMNEACSAGTGSFLEESAAEALGIGVEEIEGIALSSTRPPNFNDQCSAFIGSDLKTAAQEGLRTEDLVAGLVNSVCLNYANRVKGQRPVGEKIFMQGGVCYNRAVPLAMAAIIDRPIIVPPDPGLSGAFGVALETSNRIAQGLLPAGAFDLAELADAEISYGKSFVCKGGKERCDRSCEIAVAMVNGRKMPFGGACNRFYNRRNRIEHDVEALDFVRWRQAQVYAEGDGAEPAPRRPRVGISRSYLTNTFYPLFGTFFRELGCEVVLSDGADADGCKRRRSSFCYPGELAHGFLGNLFKKELDYVFLPKIMALQVENSVSQAKEHQSTCVLLQSEAYYLKSAFKQELQGVELLSPLLDFSAGVGSMQPAFEALAAQLGVERSMAAIAYRRAANKQREVIAGFKARGKAILTELEADPRQIAVVLFGRSYNAFAGEANMGIPGKFASRGVRVIPWDFLPFEEESCQKDMCWAIGQELLKAARFVSSHPQLFGSFVTNFSCGPDSFLVTNFRDLMGAKPSLTLELDSHTADAGINTRIEAFLDIVERYRQIEQRDRPAPSFTPAQVVFKGSTPHFVTSEGQTVSFMDPRVRLLIPSMGDLSSQALAAAFRGIGVRSEAIPVYEYRDLQIGRNNASCKECLPLLLTTGGLLRHLKERREEGELTAYFMPFTPGNCRFPQYRVFLNNLIRKRGLKNVTLFSLTAEKGYVYKAFRGKDRLNVLKAFITADVMEDIKNALLVLAVDREAAMAEFDRSWGEVIDIFQRGKASRLYATLARVARRLSAIELRTPLSAAPKVALLGEIFVRRDDFSCQDLVARLASRGIVTKRAHFFEWLKYVDTIIKLGIYEPNFDLKGKLQFKLKLALQSRFERKIKTILSRSGLFDLELIDIEEILRYGEQFFDTRFRGESILVTGNFFKDMMHAYQGAISIGPFACMPTRVIESVLAVESKLGTKAAIERRVKGGSEYDVDDPTALPFLSIETDGNPFPQLLEARIETFCLQVERLNERRAGKALDAASSPAIKPIRKAAS